MKLALIAAVAENGVIGHNGRLPWHLPADLAFFRKTTLGHPVVLGRASHESIGGPLKGRETCVLSRNPAYRPTGGGHVFARLDDALDYLQGHERVFILGGEQVFREALSRNLAHELVLTRVLARVEGDTFFPEFDVTQWKRVWHDEHPADAKNAFPLRFERWEALG